MLRRSFSRQFAVASCAMAAGCGRGKNGRNLVRLAIAGSSGLQYLPHIIAAELRLYEQNGIELATENLAGGSKAMRALLGGSADVVAGYFDHPIRITARGHTIRSFAVMNKCPGNVVLVSHLAKDRVRELNRLTAAVIGVTDLGSQAHWFVNYIASTHGITPDRLNVVAVGMQVNAIAALERGSIDVWPGFEPGITRFLNRHPEASILADARSPEGLTQVVGSTTYPGAVLYASANWLETNGDNARRLGRAIRTALRWIQEHTPDEILEKVPDRYTGADRKVYLQALRNSYEMYSPDGLMPGGGPEIAFKVLSASVPELRGESFDLKDTWTNTFIQN